MTHNVSVLDTAAPQQSTSRTSRYTGISQTGHDRRVFRPLIESRTGAGSELRAAPKPADIAYPPLLTPITTAFAHPNASAMDIARTGREVRSYVTGNWARLAGGLPFGLSSTKIKVIRGCAVVLSSGGSVDDLDQLTIDDFAWISNNVRALAPHAQKLRSSKPFKRENMEAMLGYERSSATRAISANRSAKTV